MKTALLVITLILPLSSNLVLSQVIGVDKIDESKVSPWNLKSTDDYQHVYHFGYSEMESDLILFLDQERYYGQIKLATWSEKINGWVMTYRNLTNARVEGNKFYSDQTNGEFVIYDKGQEKVKGLKVFKPWSGMTEAGEYEIGTQSYPIEEYFQGKYPQASQRRLTKDELAKTAKTDLKIMRNEIFARYGYTFKAGGAMDTHFKAQEWYIPQNSNVNEFLTAIEKENIKLLRKLESE